MEETPKRVLEDALEYTQREIDQYSRDLGNLQNQVQQLLIHRDKLLTQRQEIERALRG